ncbi:helix-turn-helix domain-containing protein [Sphingopyxis indica]|uniref:Helix-turn-helix domain-containing protein n=1 Tax=Sphingopyxis indica TaxID=436663 RepID=A0A239IWL8_9SPHN|nr:helix-turn-helix domain-containing protein [Sphingopyxis indica]SNS97782.1 Helix-turn-helix domain-containing protein [Sphingopyxis indica]
MDYQEQLSPTHLAGLIKTRWTLRGTGKAVNWVEQNATPDGCIEVIFRSQGRSSWKSEQPSRFVVGLITRSQPFQISGDASFDAIRLWPWAVSLFSDLPLGSLADRWAPWDGPSIPEIVRVLENSPRRNREGIAILGATTVAEMSSRCGRSPRRLQRWFQRNVGLPPRKFLQLRRFQSAFETLPCCDNLADHAAEYGFADQAHMTREIKRLSGASPKAALDRAKGPFLR